MQYGTTYAKALDIYRDHGTTSALVRYWADGSKTVCLVGAIAEAKGALIDGSAYRLPELEPLASLALEMFPHHCGASEGITAGDIVVWVNDSLGREAVEQLLEKAIAQADEICPGS